MEFIIISLKLLKTTKLSHSNSNIDNGFFDSPTLHSGNLGPCVAGNRQHQPPPAAQELAMKGDGGDRGGGGWGSRSRCRCSSRRTDQFQRKSESGNTSEMVRVNQECKCEIFAREKMQGERRRRHAGVRSRKSVCGSRRSVLQCPGGIYCPRALDTHTTQDKSQKIKRHDCG